MCTVKGLHIATEDMIVKRADLGAGSAQPKFTRQECCMLDEWPVFGSCTAALGHEANGSSGPTTSLWTLSPRPQQRPVAPIDHLPRVAQEGHHGVALGGTLPFVAAHLGQAVQDLRDLAVGGAGFATVIGAQHQLGAAQALVGQAAVGGHFPAMHPGEQAIHRLDPREAVRIEGG